MAMALRPMNLGEILDRTLEIYRKNLLLFIGIAAIPELVMLSIHLADDMWLHLRTVVHSSREQGRVLWEAALILVYFHAASFLGLLFVPAHAQACSNTIFGRRASLRDSIRFAVARWRSYLWIAFLRHLAQLVIPEILTVVLMFLFAFAAYALGVINGPPATVAIFVVFLPILIYAVFALWLGARLALAIPVVAFEGPTGMKALRRGWALSNGGRWRIAFTWGSINAIAWTVMLTMQYLVRALANFLYRSHHIHGFNQNHYNGMLHVMYAPVIIALGPVYPIALTLLYYDQRVRREGFDIERMMEAAGLTAPPMGEDVVNEIAAREAASESI